MKHLSMDSKAASLATDFYQLTMLYAYFTADIGGEVTFEYFVRRLPRGRRFMVLAGVEQALAYLRDLRFSGEQIDFLRQTPTFATVDDAQARERFFEWLRAMRFRGQVRAAPEGTIFFPNEPMMQLTGDLLECQLVETTLLSLLNYQTLVASKAARVRLAAGDKTLIDFGSRRAHGPQAAVLAARAAIVGGFDGTSNVLAAQQLGLAPVGTAAHAYTMAFEQEEDAFAHYLATYPETTTLLIDTYDTPRGARRAAALGAGVKGVRLDSGDLGALARQVRGILDDAGLTDARIVASNDLNELKIQRLLAERAPIDVFGVGTELVTSRDDPTLSGVYKLVEKIIDGQPVPTMKLSSSKPSYPGRKDVYRYTNAQGHPVGGALVQAGETPPMPADATTAAPMLTPVFSDEAPTIEAPTIEAIRAHTLTGLKSLPEALRELDKDAPAPAMPLHISDATQAQIDACRARYQV